MKKIGGLFLEGLIAIVPIALTLYVLYWLMRSAESTLGSLIKLIISNRYYLPGMGIIAGILIILAVGLLLRLWLFKKTFNLAQMVLTRIPLVKSLYGSLRDLMSFFDTTTKKNFDKVVTVALTEAGPRLLGLVTREDFRNLPDDFGDDQTVAVYLPMSYQLGGFTIYIPKSRIHPIDMSIEEAMRFTLTAAVSTQKQQISENTP
jgi:uncharacterized membrane protein